MWLPDETIQEYDSRIAKQIGYDLEIKKTPEIAERNRKRVSEISKMQKELNDKMQKEIEEIKLKYKIISDPLRDEENFLLRGRI